MRKNKTRKKMLLHFYSPKELKEFQKVPRAAVLQWLEETNKFLYELDPVKWKKDEARMKRIGW